MKYEVIKISTAGFQCCVDTVVMWGHSLFHVCNDYPKKSKQLF